MTDSYGAWRCKIVLRSVSTLGRWVSGTAICAAMLLIWGCGQRSAPGVAPSLSASSQRVAGIPLAMLDKAGLQVAWLQKLPLGCAESVERIFHHQGRLFVLDDHNRLYALDARQGTIAWSQDLAAARLPCSPVYYYQDSMLFVLGNTFVQVRCSDGMIQQTMEIKYPVSTSVARTDELIFVGSTNGRFYALRSTDGIPIWQSLCADEPLGSVAIYQDKVYFVTKDNTLFVSATNDRQAAWPSYTANGTLVGAVVADEQCLLPSGDTTLYCFDSGDGSMRWKYLAGGSLAELPVLTPTAIYQPVEHMSLLCLERQIEPHQKQGQLRWKLPDGACLLAENGTATYAMTLNRELTLMDNITGQQKLSFYVQNMDIYARNSETAMIFLASRTGTFLALKPTRIEVPLEPYTTATEYVEPLTEPVPADNNDKSEGEGELEYY